MTSAAALQLLESLAAQDIRLISEGGKLRVNAPKGALSDKLKAAIAAQRDALVRALEERSAAVVEAVHQPIRPVPRGGAYPLSSAQKRFWFLDQMAPGRPEYNIGLTLRLRGSLDRASLQRSLDALVKRHETLRTRLVAGANGPVAEILPPAPAVIEWVELQESDPQQRHTELFECLESRIGRGFDLASGAPCRFFVVRGESQDHILGLIMHHAMGDGWSLSVAAAEIFRGYEAYLADAEPHLPELALQYIDYACWEQDQLRGGSMARKLEYWKQELADAPALLDMPFDKPRPAVQSYRGLRLHRVVDQDLLQRLKELSRREGVTLFMTLLAAWQVLLHRYSGQDDVVVGSPMANRAGAAFQGLIGCLVNNVVLRGRLGGNPTFSEYLTRVKRMTLDAFENGEVPFDALVEAVNPQRTTSHAPLFQIMFTFMSFLTKVKSPVGLVVEWLDESLAEAGVQSSRFDLSVDLSELDKGGLVAEGKGGLLITYEYSTDLFETATIERLHLHFESLLAAVAADSARPIRELPLITAMERTQVLDECNATAREHDRNRSVHHLLQQTAWRRPSELAVTDGQQQLTYGQLEERSNRLAHLLIGRGVTTGSLVGVCLDRTVAMPVVLAAVLKAGAAYVPLDPTHPADRLAYIVEDSGAAYLVTSAGLAERLDAARVPKLTLEELDGELARQPIEPPHTRSDPEDVAYVIYTSGSTGRPKGVEVEHRNLVSFLEAMWHEPGISENDVLLAVTTLAFDIAGLEMWLPLMVGAQIVIASRADVLDGARLVGLIEQRQVSVLQATPATWRLLLETGWQGAPRMKALCGGEALPRDLAASLLARVGELWNVYGPTETTIWSTLHRIRDPHAAMSIGHPIANTRVYVLEPSGLPAPIGVAGELCIAGEGVARGYRNRPELTAEKFVELQLPNGRHERAYRTGDLARFRREGTLEFIGRRDTQVKIRGYRIELGEIESVLAAHAGVKECVAIVREDTPGDQRLVAYLVPDANGELDAEAARARLRTRLPEYMVPNQFVTLGALPLTPNGKIDRKALLMPQTAAAANPDEAAEAATMTPAQRQVAAAWREVLNVPQVGLNRNFFDLGGHSLLLLKLHAALTRDFGRSVPLVELFQRTTVATQAERFSVGSSNSDSVERAQARAMRQLHG